jgi:hypothetical protein
MEKEIKYKRAEARKKVAGKGRQEPHGVQRSAYGGWRQNEIIPVKPMLSQESKAERSWASFKILSL